MSRDGLSLLRRAALAGTGLLAVLAAGGCEQRLELAPGIVAPAAPRQWETTAAPFERAGFRLEPRAAFSLQGKLLSRRHYGGDRLAAVAPWDFALGWGPMSDEASVALVSFTQGDRFLFRRALHRSVAMELVDSHSANLHLIPADRELERVLQTMRPGMVIELDGQLVDLVLPGGGERLPTSLSRADIGAGACEILYVEAARILLPAPDESRPASVSLDADEPARSAGVRKS